MAALLWKLADQTLELSERAMIMGVINVTPDSFSDGGEFFNTDRAVEHGTRMLEDGAQIIDIGGESTRPGSAGVAAEEEAKRVMPVITQLLAAGAKLISI